MGCRLHSDHPIAAPLLGWLSALALPAFHVPQGTRLRPRQKIEDLEAYFSSIFEIIYCQLHWAYGKIILLPGGIAAAAAAAF